MTMSLNQAKYATYPCPSDQTNDSQSKGSNAVSAAADMFNTGHDDKSRDLSEDVTTEEEGVAKIGNRVADICHGCPGQRDYTEDEE